MKQARGLRNNNPLNIIKSEKINWQGEVKPSTDPNFAQFETMEYGLRAALCLLRTYYNKHGCSVYCVPIIINMGAGPLGASWRDGTLRGNG